ncbi:hypothetical protein QEJ31_03670 [Pigmentibacter sp. JX0631]|uniref:hypothetical protein n=1 Tax=Pigmentibacter sp. JX0631 TaxID=2976982 RepID=UPI002469C178|nr:hypothetical protein [Pigmentibacter sp. JX0631]WGL60701.1 hypothetical protein QEJ31_03670 [Pigmentibacter sp. JX0631]
MKQNIHFVLKNILILTLFFSTKLYANNINFYLNSKIANNFVDLKKNVESACIFESPYNKKCMSYSTLFNEYFISRGNFSVEYNNLNSGSATTVVICHITKNKLKYVTNPFSIDKNFLDYTENFEYQFNIKFNWFVDKNVLKNKKYFFITNQKLQIEFITEPNSINQQIDQTCLKKIFQEILNLNAVPLT